MTACVSGNRRRMSPDCGRTTTPLKKRMADAADQRGGRQRSALGAVWTVCNGVRTAWVTANSRSWRSAVATCLV